jgi:hypothetical protein
VAGPREERTAPGTAGARGLDRWTDCLPGPRMGVDSSVPVDKDAVLDRRRTAGLWRGDRSRRCSRVRIEGEIVLQPE